MVNSAKHFPKFIAFLQLFYPTLYKQLNSYVEDSDLVKANLICSNNTHSYQAIILSEDVSKDGELFEIYTGKDSIMPYSWDWRWVFAVNILFEEKSVFPIKFKQKVIALPTGKHPLTNVFFNILEDEFDKTLNELRATANNTNISIHECYLNYCNSINL